MNKIQENTKRAQNLNEHKSNEKSINSKSVNSMVQSFAELPLNSVIPNNYNPRKLFNEQDLLELSESIKSHGVIQPITVRLVGKNKYEVVCGERRYRASLLAELKSIPACVKELSDEEALEFAITENLQRKNVSPVEEAEAFNKLVNTNKYTIADLSQKFGKSEAFIRTRIKLSQLILDFVLLLENERIQIGVANVLANYSEELQNEIYNNHFSENAASWNQWYDINAKQLKQHIDSNYSSKLESYEFDKLACSSCPNNTSNFTLFTEKGDSRCTNAACLKKKNEEFVISRVLELIKDNPEYAICTERWNGASEDIIASLNGMEYEVKVVRTECVPEKPEEPIVDDYEDNEEYLEAVEDYQSELESYEEEYKAFTNNIELGVVIPCVEVSSTNACIRYVKSAKMNTVSSDETNQENSKITELQQKLQRNEEIRGEKKIEEFKAICENIKLPQNDICETEEFLLYFFLLNRIRRQAYSDLGLDEDLLYLSNEERLSVAKNLPSEQKKLVVREYINSHLEEFHQKYSENNLLKSFLSLHASDEIANIEEKINTVYDKRNARLVERIQEIKEKAE